MGIGGLEFGSGKTRFPGLVYIWQYKLEHLGFLFMDLKTRNIGFKIKTQIHKMLFQNTKPKFSDPLELNLMPSTPRVRIPTGMALLRRLNR